MGRRAAVACCLVVTRAEEGLPVPLTQRYFAERSDGLRRLSVLLPTSPVRTMFLPMIRWLTKRLSRRTQPEPESRAPSWHGVSIVAGATCCARARSSRGRKWLPGEAPRLPLPGCDARKCECVFRHHQDRRERRRRNSDWVGTFQPYAGPERRLGPRSRRLADV